MAGYVGQTAVNTAEAVKRALGGILFIDEAYSLVRSSGAGDGFGQEAVDTLAKLMEDNRDNLVVIVAGYWDEMERFIRANPGLRWRFPKTVHFPDYSTEELVTIFKGTCAREQYDAPDATLLALSQHLRHLPRTADFGDGRLVRNIFENAIGRQATRLASLDAGLAGLAPDDLTLLTPDDLGLPTATYEPTGPDESPIPGY